MNYRTFRFLAAAIVLSLVLSAHGLELLAWNGDQVDLLNASTYTTPSTTATGVVSGTSGSLLGGSITINTTLNAIVYANGYLQFAVTAAGTHDLAIEDFRLSTSLVSLSALTTLSVSTTEGGPYSNLASLSTINIGTNTLTFPAAESVAAGSTKFFRLSSLAAAFSFSQSEPAVLAFHGTTTPVPEPSSIALAILASGTLGFVARRQRRPGKAG